MNTNTLMNKSVGKVLDRWIKMNICVKTEIFISEMNKSELKWIGMNIEYQQKNLFIMYSSMY